MLITFAQFQKQWGIDSKAFPHNLQLASPPRELIHSPTGTTLWIRSHNQTFFLWHIQRPWQLSPPKRLQEVIWYAFILPNIVRLYSTLQFGANDSPSQLSFVLNNTFSVGLFPVSATIPPMDPSPNHIGSCCQKAIVYNHDQVSQGLSSNATSYPPTLPPALPTTLGFPTYNLCITPN